MPWGRLTVGCVVGGMTSRMGADGKPVFIFSAGWRSGSTLVQRLISSTGEVLVWGESGGALNCIAEAMERFEQMLGPGSKRYRFGYGGNGALQYETCRQPDSQIAHQWIASMNAPRSVILKSISTLFHQVYQVPAKERGFPRWGVKEVQCGIDTAKFLRDLYPQSKFVFFIRDPFACLRSIKKRDWMDMKGSREPLRFYAEHWRRLVNEFLGAGFGLVLKYESLVDDPMVVEELCDYVEITCVSPYGFIRRSHVDWPPARDVELTRMEKWKIRGLLKTEIERFGYGSG